MHLEPPLLAAIELVDLVVELEDGLAVALESVA